MPMGENVQAPILLIDFKKICQRPAKGLRQNDSVDACVSHDEDVSPCGGQSFIEGRNDTKGTVEKTFSLVGAKVDNIQAPCMEFFRVPPSHFIKGQAFPSAKRDLTQFAPWNA